MNSYFVGNQFFLAMLDLESIQPTSRKTMSISGSQSNDFTLLSYHKQGNWQCTLNLLNGKNKENNFYNELYLWVKPSEEDLNFIGEQMRTLNINTLYSVGCGTGLLEWLIECSTGLTVVGIEVDRAWWESQYAPPKFLSFVYADENSPLTFTPNSAIMFCYFNNGPAFEHYMRNFPGCCLIIIGPEAGVNRHTQPKPFDDSVRNLGWILTSSKAIGNTKDHIAIYHCKA